MVTEPHATAMKQVYIWGGPRTAFVEWVSSEGAIDWDEVKRRLQAGGWSRLQKHRRDISHVGCAGWRPSAV